MNIPLDEWSGAGATKELHKTIVALNEATTKQTNAMVALTWAITIMTFVMMVGVGAQIFIALDQRSETLSVEQVQAAD